MARVNVYLPDELAELVRGACPGLNVSGVLQAGLRELLGCDHATALDAAPAQGVRATGTSATGAGGSDVSPTQGERVTRPPRSPCCDLGEHLRCADGAAIACRCSCHLSRPAPRERGQDPGRPPFAGAPRVSALP
jgi:hypothetical protein